MSQNIHTVQYDATMSSTSSDIKEGKVLLPIEGSTLGWSSMSRTPMSPVFITIKIGSFFPKLMVTMVNYKSGECCIIDPDDVHSYFYDGKYKI